MHIKYISERLKYVLSLTWLIKDKSYHIHPSTIPYEEVLSATGSLVNPLNLFYLMSHILLLHPQFNHENYNK